MWQLPVFRRALNRLRNQSDSFVLVFEHLLGIRLAATIASATTKAAGYQQIAHSSELLSALKAAKLSESFGKMLR